MTITKFSANPINTIQILLRLTFTSVNKCNFENEERCKDIKKT